MEFNSKQYYKDVMTADEEYEIVLNEYIHKLGITDTVCLDDYETLEQLKDHVNKLFLSSLSCMWNDYYDFCMDKLNNKENMNEESSIHTPVIS